LQVTTRYPPHLGGIENSVFNLVRRLEARGHEVQVITSDDPHIPKAESNVLRVPVRLKIVASWGEMPICPSVFGAVREAQADVIHAHLPPRQFADMCTLSELTRTNKRPVIVHFRLYQEFSSPFFEAVSAFHYGTLGYLTLHRASRILVGSLQYKGLLVDRFRLRPSKICLMPNPVDDEVYDPKRVEVQHARKKFGAEGTVILFTGRLVDHKGLGYLLRAYANVAANYSDTHLFLAGVGPLQESLSKQVDSLGLKAYVRFLGGISPSDMPTLLAASDIFVLPSLFEHSSNSMREAMAMEKPVIVSRVGDAPEVITNRKNGLLVAPRDVEGLSDALNSLLTNRRLARRMGAEARRTVRRRYSWDAFVGNLLDVYNEVIAEK
jgi:glycogen(starch) synthase